MEARVNLKPWEQPTPHKSVAHLGTARPDPEGSRLPGPPCRAHRGCDEGGDPAATQPHGAGRRADSTVTASPSPADRAVSQADASPPSDCSGRPIVAKLRSDELSPMASHWMAILRKWPDSLNSGR